jgi:hypothetical protein
MIESIQNSLIRLAEFYQLRPEVTDVRDTTTPSTLRSNNQNTSFAKMNGLYLSLELI